METLRFLMVSSHFPPYHMGGDAVFVKYLSDELIRKGHEVNVLYNPDAYTLIRGKKPAARPFVDETNPTRNEYASPFGTYGPLLALTLGWSHGASVQLNDLAKKLRPDVVHWHNTKGFIGRPTAIRGSVSLYTAHDFYSVCPRSNLLRPGLRLCERPRLCQLCLLRWRKPPQLWRISGRRTVRFPSEFTVLSPSEFLAARLAEDGIRVKHVLRNFVPDKQGLISSRKAPTTILYLGVLEVLKGPQMLLEAFARTKDHHEFNLRIMGDGTLRKELMSRVVKLGLADRVKIPGFVPLEEMSSILEETAFLVIPTVAYENAPLAALEAFSMGIPVLGSNLGGLPEMLGPESGSMVFQGGDISSLGTSLCLLWDQMANRAVLGRKAREAYESKYSPDTHIRKYMAIVNDVMR